MSVSSRTSREIIERVLQEHGRDEVLRRLAPRLPDQDPLPPRVPAGNRFSAEGLARRQAFFADRGVDLSPLIGPAAPSPEEVQGNVENHLGSVALPLGVAGPLRINGTAAHGDYYLPLATTEGALVASCTRGAHVVNRAGGVTAACLTESVGRAPCFVMDRLTESAVLLDWILDRFDALREVAEATSRHCRLTDFKTAVNGKELFVLFEYTTGDAAGQNMVTLATEALCRYIVEHAPVKPRRWYIEGNLSGDKKATMLGFMYARGKKVVAEAVVPAEPLRRFLRAGPEDLRRYWEVSILGGAQSGSIGVQGHYANPLAALFIACGQDVACVAEASVGLTRMDVTGDGELYLSVSLPNLIVGTVGGGTGLPGAATCLGLLDCAGPGKARAFAEICAAAALAAELSIIGALAAGEFTAAHARYGRKRD